MSLARQWHCAQVSVALNDRGERTATITRKDDDDADNDRWRLQQQRPAR